MAFDDVETTRRVVSTVTCSSAPKVSCPSQLLQSSRGTSGCQFAAGIGSGSSWPVVAAIPRLRDRRPVEHPSPYAQDGERQSNRSSTLRQSDPLPPFFVGQELALALHTAAPLPLTTRTPSYVAPVGACPARDLRSLVFSDFGGHRPPLQYLPARSPCSPAPRVTFLMGSFEVEYSPISAYFMAYPTETKGESSVSFVFRPFYEAILCFQQHIWLRF